MRSRGSIDPNPHVHRELDLDLAAHASTKEHQELVQRAGQRNRIPLEDVVEGDHPRTWGLQAVADGVVGCGVDTPCGGERAVHLGGIEIEELERGLGPGEEIDERPRQIDGEEALL